MGVLEGFCLFWVPLNIALGNSQDLFDEASEVPLTMTLEPEDLLRTVFFCFFYCFLDVAYYFFKIIFCCFLCDVLFALCLLEIIGVWLFCICSPWNRKPLSNGPEGFFFFSAKRRSKKRRRTMHLFFLLLLICFCCK